MWTTRQRRSSSAARPRSHGKATRLSRPTSTHETATSISAVVGRAYRRPRATTRDTSFLRVIPTSPVSSIAPGWTVRPNVRLPCCSRTSTSVTPRLLSCRLPRTTPSRRARTRPWPSLRWPTTHRAEATQRSPVFRPAPAAAAPLARAVMGGWSTPRSTGSTGPIPLPTRFAMVRVSSPRPPLQSRSTTIVTASPTISISTTTTTASWMPTKATRRSHRPVFGPSAATAPR